MQANAMSLMMKICLIVFLHIALPIKFVTSDLSLTILHTNDVHARIEQFNTYGGTCPSNTSSTCFGGVARRHAIVEKIRAQEQNVVLLDAGDQYQGTLWHNVYGGLAAIMFMNYSKYDVMALGNHEFDDGVEGLVPFLEQAAFAVVCSNIDFSAEKKWPRTKTLVTKSTVLERSGTKIGIVGYLTPDTAWLSQGVGDVKFSDVITAVRQEAALLVAGGVRVIIALGHAGIETDKKIAQEVLEVDIVVGGHTNTFLYNGAQPSIEAIEGPYPIQFTRADGSSVLVVQDFTYGKYLGFLKVTLDDDGKIKSWSGNPILLNSSIPEDPRVLKLVYGMDDTIHELIKEPVGYTLVHLDGDRQTCRHAECNLGNLIADAIVRMNQANPDDDKWATLALGVWNGGAVRSSIVKNRTDPITVEDLASVLPFGTIADIVELEGWVLLEMFEHSVSAVEVSEGRFLQVSGFRLTYDITKPVGQRLLQAKALCLQCRIPTYEPIQLRARYKVAMPGYIVSGGDKYDMLKKNILARHPGEDAMVLLRDYIKRESPITQAVEGRIMFMTGTKSSGRTLNFSLASLLTCALLAAFAVGKI